jgi:hypothetical protein
VICSIGAESFMRRGRGRGWSGSSLMAVGASDYDVCGL